MQTSHARWLVAAGLLVGCGAPDGSDVGNTTPDFRDGTYYYVLGYDPETGEQIKGGSHEVVTFDESGKREPIDAQNRVSRFHPDMTSTSAYHAYDGSLTEGETSWDVFPSTWWPQSKNGTAWRWQVGASQDYNDLGDADRLSPMEKYDLTFHPDQRRVVPAVSHCEYRDYIEDPDNCERIEHPELTVAGPATKWELENQGTYQWVEPENWWGHCNGWASYATAEPLGFPRRDIQVRIEDGNVVECTGDTAGCVLWRMADIEALMTELYFSDRATFSGRRCNVTPDDMERDELGRPTDVECRDLNPGSFHVGITGLLGRGARNLATDETGGRPAFVIDHNHDHEIWNFPIKGYEITQDEAVDRARAQELVGGNGSSYQFNAAAAQFRRIQLAYFMISDSVPANQLAIRADQRSIAPVRVELNYVLELDSNGRILGGEWIEDPVGFFGADSKSAHPDFMWIALEPQGYGEGPDDTGGDSDNPYVAYSAARQLLLCANEPSSCAPSGGGGGGGALIDVTASVDRGDADDYDTGVVEAGRYTVTLTGNGGDADLYVRVGSRPTSSAYDCRPYLNGSNETCEIELTTADTIFVQVQGYAVGANDYRLTVNGGGGGGGNAWDGIDESGDVVANQEDRFVTPTLPAGNYIFTITGSADADLYTRVGAAPTTSSFGCRPYLSGSDETCRVTLPSPGTIHVMVRGYAPSSTYRLVGSED